MEREAIEKIEELAKVEIIKVNDLSYSSKNLNLIDFEPDPVILAVSTLTGFIDYIAKNVDQLEKDSLMIQVVGYDKVILYSKLCGKFKKRNYFIKAVLEDHFKTFVFGQFMDQESFIINMMCYFQDNEDYQRVLRIVGNLTAEETTKSVDDGISQMVTAKTGIAKVDRIKVVNPVILKPYRTFREINQPESPFIIRIRDGQNGPSAALFEADGGQWRLEAIKMIKEYLIEKLEGFVIIA